MRKRSFRNYDDTLDDPAFDDDYAELEYLEKRRHMQRLSGDSSGHADHARSRKTRRRKPSADTH